MPIKEIILVGCWAHSRRRFFDAAKSSKITGSAHEGLKKIRKLYAIEDEARKGKYDTDEIKAIRQEKAVPILADIKTWLDEKIHQVPPACLLGKAIDCATKNWDKLNRYVEDGIIPIDNNGVENLIRPYVVGRKNWLFAVKGNVSIDWKYRENIRAKLRIIVKKILKKYGYPPDKQQKATDTVLEQADLFSEEWAV